MNTIDRIKKEAEAYAEKENSAYVNDYNGYQQGASIWAARAEKLLKVLENWAAFDPRVCKSVHLSQLWSESKTALEQYKNEMK